MGKDRNPSWSPATLAEVTDAAVERFFTPLGEVDVERFFTPLGEVDVERFFTPLGEWELGLAEAADTTEGVVW